MDFGRLHRAKKKPTKDIPTSLNLQNGSMQIQGTCDVVSNAFNKYCLDERKHGNADNHCS
jgi:hypothetical protein